MADKKKRKNLCLVCKKKFVGWRSHALNSVTCIVCEHKVCRDCLPSPGISRHELEERGDGFRFTCTGCIDQLQASFLDNEAIAKYFAMEKSRTPLKELNAAQSDRKSEDIKWSLESFDILNDLLGSGSFGRVVLAREKKSKFIVALKILDQSWLNQYQIEEQVKREIKIQSSLRHPNIVRLFGFFRDDSEIYLITEYAAKGNLGQHLKQQPDGRFTEARAANYMAQIADALMYLQSKKLAHRDLKTENLLIGFHGEIKVCDFGCSVEILEHKRRSMCGTPLYMAPEMCDMDADHDLRVDLWALGVLCYKLLVGYTPFDNGDWVNTRKRILEVDLHFPPDKGLSLEAQNLISALLKYEANDRLALKEIIAHPWIQQHLTEEVQSKLLFYQIEDRDKVKKNLRRRYMKL